MLAENICIKYGTLNFNRLSTTNSEIIEILRNKKELRKKKHILKLQIKVDFLHLD